MDDIVQVAVAGVVFGFDRSQALDLRHLWIDGADLAPGPRPETGPDPVVDRALQGLIFTCGPDHIRQPCRVASVDWPLHGSLIRQPSSRPILHTWTCGATAVATVLISSPAGFRATVFRRYTIRDRQGPEIFIEDLVCNHGPGPMMPMLMYHLNFRSDLLAEATVLNGRRLASPAVEAWRCGPAPPVVRLGPLAEFDACVSIVPGRGSLPWLQFWQRPDILAIEPVSHQLRPRTELEQRHARVLNPSEEIRFSLRIRIRLPHRNSIDEIGSGRA